MSGSVIAILSTIPFAMIGGHTAYVSLAIFMVVQGFGVGLSGMPAMTAAFRTLRPQQINDATPQSNMLMRVGGSLGVAILSVVLDRALVTAGSSTSAQAAAFANSFWWVLGIAVISLVPTSFVLIMERQNAHLPTNADLSAITHEGG